jgi:hypothetical protein
MRDVRKYAKHQPFLEWKYILFEFNDSDEELMEAQKIAEDIGVDSMMFIVTNTRFRSERYLADRLFSFPRISPLVTVSPAASMQKVLRTGRAVLTHSNSRRQPSCHFFVDICNLLTCGVIRMEGWTLCTDGSYVDRIEVFGGNQLLSSGRPIHRRNDVPPVIKNAEGPNCGFILQFPFPKGEATVDLQIRVWMGEKSVWYNCTAQFPEFDPAVFAPRYHLPQAPLISPLSSELVSIQRAS